MHLAPEMRQNTETWFKKLQYDFKETFNDRIFVFKKKKKKKSQKVNNVVVFLNVLTNLGL